MIIAPNRHDAIIGEGGVSSIRFINIVEDLVNAVNSLIAILINNQNGSYTLVLEDAGKIIRNTNGQTNNRIFTVPSNTDVAFDIGTRVEMQNDGTQSLKVVVATDTLTSEAGLGTGVRTIAAAGSAILTKVTAIEWKIRGEQLT